MPAKRSLSSPSTPRRKRVKSIAKQRRIDQFFPGSPQTLSGENSSNQTKDNNTPSSSKGSGAREIIELLDSDDESLPDQRSDVTKFEVGSSSKPKSIALFAGLNELPKVDVAAYTSLSSDPAFFTPEASGLLAAKNAPVSYSFLAHALSLVSGTRSRILIVNILTNAFRVIMAQHPGSLLPAIYLLSNTLAPPYSPVELGLG